MSGIVGQRENIRGEGSLFILSLTLLPKHNTEIRQDVSAQVNFKGHRNDPEGGMGLLA